MDGGHLVIDGATLGCCHCRLVFLQSGLTVHNHNITGGGIQTAPGLVGRKSRNSERLPNLTVTDYYVYSVIMSFTSTSDDNISFEIVE